MALVPAVYAQPDPTTYPAYIQLQRPVLINADLWEASPRIMAANYGFEGIMGIPQYFSVADLSLAVAAGAGVNQDWAVLDPVPPLRNVSSAGGTLGVAIAGFGAYSLYADAMPIEVSWPLLPGTVQPDNIAITLNTGQTVNPVAAALNPNYDHNERHVVVVFGQFGNRLSPGVSGAIYPVNVAFVSGNSDMMAVGPDGPVALTGLTSLGSNPYVAGPALVGAKLNRFSPVGDFSPPALNTAFPNDGFTLYGEDAQYRLRLYTSGGFSPDGVSGFLPTDFDQAFRLHAINQNGDPVVITRTGQVYDLGVGELEVVGLAEVGGPLDSPIVSGQPDRAYYVEDHDNYFDVILKGDEAAIRLLQSVEIPTSQEAGYMDIYNPGGPGRTPVTGVTYTKPALPQTFAVDLSLDAQRTISYADQNLSRYDQDDDLPVVLRLRQRNGDERLTPSSILATRLIDEGQALVDIPFANEASRPGVTPVRSYLSLETGSRIYTLDAQEQAALAASSSWQDEGDVFGAFDRAWPGAGAYYRFWDALSDQYFFDGNLNAVFQSSSLDYQGVSWYAAQFVAQPTELLFSRDEALVLTDYIQADSQLVKQGDGALTLAAGGRFSGGIEVEQSLLLVNGLLSGGDLNVRAGATIGGNATIANKTDIKGKLAPGNSAGTITFLAPVTMSSVSTLALEVDGPMAGSAAESYDRIVVLGAENTFTAAGTVEVFLRGITPPASNDFTPSLGQRFVGIVSAQGGVRDSFDGLQQPQSGGLAAGTRMDLLYSDRTIDLVVTPANYGQLSAAGLSQTTNEQAVGLALDSFRPAAGVKPKGAAGEIFPPLAALPGDEIAAALASFSGDFYASLKSPLIESGRFMREASLDRIRAGFGGVATSAAMVTNGGQSLSSPPGSEAPSPVSGAGHRAVGWAQIVGGWERYNSDGNRAGLNHDTRWLLMGVDVPVTAAWQVGAVAGFGQATADLTQHNASADISTYSLGLYSGKQWNETGLRLGASYAWHDINSSRRVAFTGFGNSLSAFYQAKSAQLFGEMGYQLDFSPARIELFAAMTHIYLSTPYFSESGGVSALTVNGSNSHTTFTVLGVRGDRTFKVGRINARARGTMGWRHASGDITPTSIHAFVLGSSFSVSGVAIAQDAGTVSMGMDVSISQQATFGLYYEGQFASQSQQHGVSANLSVQF